MGLSVRLPPGPKNGDAARVTVRFAEYIVATFEVGAATPCA